MARYIDADKLWNDRPQIPEGKSQDYGAGFSECMWGFSRNIRKQIDTESADVVPKSEVEKIFEEIENILYKFAYPSLTAIGKINVINAEGYHIHTRDYAELKKKYTEGKK